MSHNKKVSRFPSIFDIEASGFGSESYPIEVGVVTGSGRRYCALIKPEADWTHWNEDAEKIHGITRRKLGIYGKPAHQVCTELNQVLGNSKVYSDGWSHDKRWLIRLYHAVKMSPSFMLSPIESIASEEQLMIWDETREAVAVELGLVRHRASNDALVIQQTYIESRRAIGREKILPPLKGFAAGAQN